MSVDEPSIEVLIASGLVAKNVARPKKCKYAEAARLRAIEQAQRRYAQNLQENSEYFDWAKSHPKMRGYLSMLEDLGEKIEFGRQYDAWLWIKSKLEFMWHGLGAAARVRDAISTEPDPARRRRLRMRAATPKWADWDKIAAIYAERDRLTAETGIPHHVDHILPLAGRMVCGLHVHWNLRAIPASDNVRKGAKVLH